MVDIGNLGRRVMELGLANKTFSASYALSFRDSDFKNVILCGFPASVFYHDDHLEMCHQITEQVALEVIHPNFIYTPNFNQVQLQQPK